MLRPLIVPWHVTAAALFVATLLAMVRATDSSVAGLSLQYGLASCGRNCSNRRSLALPLVATGVSPGHVARQRWRRSAFIRCAQKGR